MAEFSKEYCQMKMPEFEGDFSIHEEFEKLHDGEYVSMICEGYGFIGIANDMGVCKLMFRVPDTDSIDFVDVKNIIY